MPQSLFDQLKQLYATQTIQRDSDTTLPTQRISAEAEPNALSGNQTNQTHLTSAAQAGSGLAASAVGNQTENKLGRKPLPPADVAGEVAVPAADVAASRRPASGGTGTSRLEADGTSGTRLPVNWQEIDPHAYQPRPFGPMETDADWPGEDEEGEDAAPLPAVDAGGDGPGALQPTPRRTLAGATSPASRRDAGATSLYPAGAIGRTASPAAGEPFADLEERCWLCEEEAELYDPSGQGWCFLCLEVAGKTEGWQDLVDLLPAAWKRREEEHQQLAVFAAAHYHQAGRREIAVRWSQPPFHQRLKGADLFRAFARWLAASERWKQREAERLLERLVEHQGMGVWRR